MGLITNDTYFSQHIFIQLLLYDENRIIDVYKWIFTQNQFYMVDGIVCSLCRK